MALIKCPECGREISNRAANCPNCGFPMNDVKPNAQENSTNDTNPSNPSKDKGRMPRWVLALIIVGSILLIGGIVLLCLSGISNRKNQPVSNADSVIDSADVEALEDFVITEEFANNINNLDADVHGFREGMALIWKKQRWGYIDKTGKVVIPMQFRFAYDFYNGRAHVQKEERGKHGYIDKKGNVVIPMQYDGAWDFDKGVATVSIGDKIGLIDTNGNVIIPIKYDAYDKRNEIYGDRYSIYFNEGLSQVSLNGKIGFIDINDNVVVPLQYDKAGTAFKEGFAWVLKDNKYGFVDNKGNIVVPLQYDYVNDYSEGLAGVKKDEKYGFVDKKGNVVVPLQYDNVDDFSEGFAGVNKDGKYGCIDKKGNVVVPMQYDYFYGFKEGLAGVGKDGKFGFIDKKGNVVVPLQYDHIKDFKEGLACVNKDGKYGFIDKKGNVVIPLEYSMIMHDFHNGLVDVSKDGKHGIINKKGDIVVPLLYDWVGGFGNEGLATVTIGHIIQGKHGYADKHGNSTLVIAALDNQKKSPKEQSTTKVIHIECDMNNSRFFSNFKRSGVGNTSTIHTPSGGELATEYITVPEGKQWVLKKIEHKDIYFGWTYFIVRSHNKKIWLRKGLVIAEDFRLYIQPDNGHPTIHLEFVEKPL